MPDPEYNAWTFLGELVVRLHGHDIASAVSFLQGVNDQIYAQRDNYSPKTPYHFWMQESVAGVHKFVESWSSAVK